MKKAKKVNEAWKIVLSLTVAFLLCGGYIAQADYNLWDRIGDTAGKILGLSLADKVADVEPSVILGAFPGPNIYSDYFCINDICRFYNKVGLRAATNTICAIQSPQATSTLISASVHFR